MISTQIFLVLLVLLIKLLVITFLVFSCIYILIVFNKNGGSHIKFTNPHRYKSSSDNQSNKIRLMVQANLDVLLWYLIPLYVVSGNKF